MRSACLSGALVAALLLGGCATVKEPSNGADNAPTASDRSSADPWERWNRRVHGFNDAVDQAVLKPVAKAYVRVVPQPVRTGVTNFYGNFADAWSAVNNLLQGKLENGTRDLARVGTNTLFGLGGLFDVATPLGIDSQREDFGQTLGRWGVPSGPYVVWPFLGPSTVRDSSAMPLDMYASPNRAFGDRATQYSLTATGLVNLRANLLPSTDLLDGMALDRYVFIRDAYLQRRLSLVHDGNVPDTGEEEFEPDPEPAAAPAAPAPAAPASGVVPVTPPAVSGAGIN